VVDKLRKTRLTWFIYVKRRCVNVSDMKRYERLVIEGTRRGRDKPKKYWGEVIRQDMT